MESVITVLIFLAVISLSIYLTYYSTDTSSSNKFDKILTFCLPFISTLVIGIAVIEKFIYLPIVITAAIIAGVVSLLVSLSAEKKAKEAKQKKNHLYIFNIYMFKKNMRSSITIERHRKKCYFEINQELQRCLCLSKTLQN